MPEHPAGKSRWNWLSLIVLLALLQNACIIEKIDDTATKQVNEGSTATDQNSGVEEGQSATTSDAPKLREAKDKQRPKVAYVTNGIASFWVIAEAGARAAAKDFDCECFVRMPPDGAGDQKRMIEELITLRVDGIAVSPIDPDNQTDLLNQAAAETNLITQDSDAPHSNRLAYIGMDNYMAGRMCGQLVKEAMPEGGEMAIFVGRLGQLNAELRRQGVIDELLDRSEDSSRRDPLGKPLQGGKYTVVATFTDGFDFGKAKANAEDAILKYPNLGCMVGLFAYNPPYMLEAVKGAGKVGDIKVIGFDEADETLQAIVDGQCYGTIVQNPFRYGYESVRMLQALARGEKALPKDGFMDIPARSIRADNVVAFWDELKDLTSGAQSPGSGSDVPVKLAFVTNNPADFWKIAEAGVRKAEKEFNAICEVHMPPHGTADDQQRIIEALIAKRIAGMAISPNDAENQIDIINQAAARMHVICHDSDAPKSDRIAYVGTRNYKAGREAGKQIKEVLPEGGEIMIFVGRMDAQNAIERSEGVKDELKGTDIKVLDIRTDLTDRARAKQNVEDTLTRHPDVGCLVGLWAYNGPAILEAVKDADLEGKMPIVCFDEEEQTLQGVKDGNIHATVVQQPYQFGYQSVRILAALARGQDSGIPADGIVEVPVNVIKQDGVQEFWDELNRLRSGG